MLSGINCGGQADISINIQHTKPPKINHDLVANIRERPSVVARCPVAAIRPAVVNGKPSLEVDERKVRLLRRLLSTLSADADQRSRTFETRDLGRGQELQRPHKAEFPEAGGQRSAE